MLKSQLEQFLSTARLGSRIWLGNDDLKVYLRWMRGINRLTLANISAAEPGKGCFRAFLKTLANSDLNRFDFIEIENVLSQQFRDFFISENWVLDESRAKYGDYCYSLIIATFADKYK